MQFQPLITPFIINIVLFIFKISFDGISIKSETYQPDMY